MNKREKQAVVRAGKNLMPSVSQSIAQAVLLKLGVSKTLITLILAFAL